MEQVLAAQQMTGSEALVRLARLARGDMRDFFDDNGQALAPHQWPEGYGSCVRGFHRTPDGIKVTLVDTLAALRMFFEVTGRMKSPVADSIDHMAEAILADRAKHLPRGDTR